MKKFLAALILGTLAPNLVAHPAVDAARAVYSRMSLQPGWCRHYTKAALDAGAEGAVVLLHPKGYDKRSDGHIAPLIRDGRGRLQVLVERSRFSHDPLSPMLGGRTHKRLHRKTIPEGADLEDYLLNLFGSPGEYEHVEVIRKLPPAVDCVIGKERELGLRFNMSWERQEEITEKAREACGLE